MKAGKGLIYKLILIALMSCALVISRGKTMVIFAFLTVVAVFLWLKSNQLSSKMKGLVLSLLMGSFVLMNFYFNTLLLKNMLPMNCVRNQHIYQGNVQGVDKVEYMAMPDAYLRELIRYKSVSVPYEVTEYKVYNPILDEEERGHGFVADYYFENNYTRYFMEYSGKGLCDKTLPKLDEVDAFIDNYKQEFTDIGITNDMLRYSFLLNQEHSKETKYFWYSWYYFSFSEEENHYPHMYVNTKDCEEHDELVAIWDRDENLYIISREKYDEIKQ